MVERQIQESLATTDITKMSHYGKPIPSLYDMNPRWVDPTEEWCNKFLQRNGYAPEWIELNKDIFGGIKNARTQLSNTYRQLFMPQELPTSFDHSEPKQQSSKSWFGNLFNKLLSVEEYKPPKKVRLSSKEKESRWEYAINEFKEEITKINKIINDYNLLVPMSRQLYHFNSALEINEIVDTCKNGGSVNNSLE